MGRVAASAVSLPWTAYSLRETNRLDWTLPRTERVERDMPISEGA